MRTSHLYYRCNTIHEGGSIHVIARPPLLPDAEIAKNDVEQILDVDATGDATEGTGSEAEIFGR